MLIHPASDRSFLIQVGNEIAPAVHARVRQVVCALDGLRGLVNLHPAYATVLAEFDPLRVTHPGFERALRKRLEKVDRTPVPASRLMEIPVRYGGTDGPDLEDVAEHTGLSSAEVVTLHAGAEYLVYFLGFSPGFPYLGGMPVKLACPRLPSPRRHVPAGSVAIGGAQTGVYPLASPGGWRIIGRTPLRLFQPDASPPTLLEMGDRVRFRPVAEGEL